MKKHQIWLIQVTEPPVNAAMIPSGEGFLSYLLTCRKFTEYRYSARILNAVGREWMVYGLWTMPWFDLMLLMSCFCSFPLKFDVNIFAEEERSVSEKSKILMHFCLEVKILEQYFLISLQFNKQSYSMREETLLWLFLVMEDRGKQSK